LPYADITLWAYFTLLKEARQEPFVCSACVGLNLYLKERAFPCYLAPVYSPLLCAARYLRNYRRLEGDFAFVSPCHLKEKEFFTREGERLIRYNITIGELRDFAGKVESWLAKCPAIKPEQDDFCPGLGLASAGSVGGVLGPLFPEKKFALTQGLPQTVSLLCEGSLRGDAVLEAYACPGGCLYGSGTWERNSSTLATKEPPVHRTGASTSNVGVPASGGGARRPADVGDYAASLRRLFACYTRAFSLADFCHRDYCP
jgi:iron only hydrogenase large subunit-like protein